MKTVSTHMMWLAALALGAAGCTGGTTPAPSETVTAIQLTETPATDIPATTADDTKSEAAGDGEDSAQGTGSLGEDHPTPSYASMQEVVDYPKGLETPSDFKAYETLASEGMVPIGNIVERLADHSGASEEELETLYNQLLFLFAADYSAIRPLKDYGYIAFQADGKDPATGQPLTTDTQINLELVLDASGSMAQQIDGRSMMDIAKASITKTVEQLPPSANVGLRVYGHKGNNKGSGKAESCASSDLIHPITPVDLGTLNSQLANINPTGWTPLGVSIENGAKDFANYQGENQLNILYVISDGIETCGGDPVASASNLKTLGVKPILGIIGFNVNPTQEINLKQIAQAGEGHYAAADSADTLVKELAQIHQLANAKYDWQPLTEVQLLELSNHLTNKGNLEAQSAFTDRVIAENNVINTAITALLDAAKIDDAGAEKLRNLNSIRYERLTKLRDALYEDREQELRQMEADWRNRLGQPAVIIKPEIE